MSDIFKHFLDRSLSHVIRFSSHEQHFRESVAEHSFYVTYFVAVICHLLKKAGETIDEAKAIKIALVHDMEEAFTGDIVSPFKHYSEELLSAIRKVNQEVIQEVFEDLPGDLSSDFISLWQEDLEQKTREAQVVKLADKISVVAKAYEEVKAGNEFFKPVYEKHFKELQELDHPWWQKIKGEILP
ncbi:MAG: HD domain-containing protein [Candidatus Colwellbacteria bacterium]|nr:HD domain-containing protein [Candidatus Colwellbacteria bacterium]